MTHKPLREPSHVSRLNVDVRRVSSGVEPTALMVGAVVS